MAMLVTQMLCLFSFAVYIYLKKTLILCDIVRMSSCLRDHCESSEMMSLVALLVMVVYKALHLSLLYCYVLKMELAEMTKKARLYWASENRKNAYTAN
jgi:hypothetical protein